MMKASTQRCYRLTLTLLWLCGQAPAAVAENTERLTLAADPQGGWQLEVRRMPLARVLDTLAEKTRVPIHYSVLPDGLVTATCVGASVKPLLNCLLANTQDVVFRTAPKSDDVTEVWIMGSNLAAASAGDKTCIASSQQRPPETTAAEPSARSAEQREALLTMSRSPRPEDRAAAIGGLLSQDDSQSDGPVDSAVKTALETAATDRDAAVRVQAVSALAQLEGDEAAGVLQDALQDDSADVRLAAIASLDNPALLQQAANDRDETVRALAREKLENLDPQRQ